MVVVLLAANYKLVLGTVVPKWDADRFYASAQMLVADHARAGAFLLWNPWANGGSPDHADPQVPAFSPIAIAVGVVAGGTELAFRVYWLVIWLLAGLGIVLLGRHLGAPPWGRSVVALGFVFSGFYTGHAEHTSTLYTISFLPFVIWRFDVALSRGAVRPAVEAGVFWGMSALGGYPGWVLLNAGFALLWTAGRAVCPAPPNSKKPAVRFAALTSAIVLSTGLVVLSPTYAATFLETPGYTERSQPLARNLAVTSNALHPAAVATFASPYLPILKQYNPSLWSYTDISTVGIYLGVVVPVLAMVALAGRPRDRWRWWIAAVGAAFLLAAFGESTPVRGWLYDVVPPMRYFRHAGFFRIYPMFATVVLALLATRDLSTDGTRSAALRRFAVAAAVVSALAIAAYYVVTERVEHPGEQPMTATLHLWLAWLSVCGTGAAAMMCAPDRRIPLLRASLLTLAIADGVVAVQLSQPTMWYENDRLKETWNRLAREHRDSLDVTSHGQQRDLRAPGWTTIDAEPHNKNLALKVPTLENYTGFNNRFHLDMVNRPVLRAMATGRQRFWCASRVATVPPSDAAYAAVIARSERLAQGVVVVHPPEQLLADVPPAGGDAGIERLPPATLAAVTLHAYRPQVLSFEARCPEEGWLLVTDRWSRSWSATVNDRPVEVWGGNFIFRAVPIEAGLNQVRFTYDAAGFPGLAIASWSVIFVTAIVSVLAVVRRPR